MEWALIVSKAAVNTMDDFRRTIFTERAPFTTLTVTSISVSGKMTREMVREFYSLQMGQGKRKSGKMERKYLNN